MAKQINETQSFGRINYESDFVIKILLPDEVGDRDFKLDFYTNVEKVVRFSRRNGILSSNLKAQEDGSCLAVFRKHGLQAGKLYVKASYITETDLSPDGEMVDVVPEFTQLTLVREAGDMGLIPIIELSLTQYFPSTDDDEGEDDNDNQNSTPATFVPSITPDSVANTKTIKTTAITVNTPIISFDAENVKLITPNGIKFLGYDGGEYVVADDKLSITINWDIDAVEGEYELRVPKGCIVLEDGAENTATNIAYNVTIAPIVYFTPEISPVSGNVSAEDMTSVVVTLPDKFGYFDSNADAWYNDIYLSYMASGGYKEEKSAKFYADITVAEDGLSITIDWSKFSFVSGITYAMNIPKGYIVLDNGDKNDSTSIEYTIA